MNFGVSIEGIVEEKIITLLHSSLVAGDVKKPLKLSGNKTVALAADGDTFHGVAHTVESDAVGVKLSGLVTMPYTGSDPGVGPVQLRANGAGGVKVVTETEDSDGKETNSSNRFNLFLVLSVDTTAKTVSFIMDNI